MKVSYNIRSRTISDSITPIGPLMIVRITVKIRKTTKAAVEVEHAGINAIIDATATTAASTRYTRSFSKNRRSQFNPKFAKRIPMIPTIALRMQ